MADCVLQKWYLYLLAILILITLSDQISSGLLKKNVKGKDLVGKKDFPKVTSH